MILGIIIHLKKNNSPCNTIQGAIKLFFYVVFFSVFFLNESYSQKLFKITGNSSDKYANGTITIKLANNDIENDTLLDYKVKIVNKKFEIQGVIRSNFHRIIFEIKKNSNKILVPLFIGQSKNMDICIFQKLKNNTDSIIYNFIPFDKEEVEYENLVKNYRNNLIELNDKLNIENNNGKQASIIHSIEINFQANYRRISEITKLYIRENSNKYISLYYFYNVILKVQSFNLDTLNNLFQEIQKHYDTSFLKKTKIYAKMQYLNSLGIGNKVCNINFISNDTITHKLSNFYSKSYLLICFWASWCSPCRKSIPLLKKIYNKYNNKELEILSISIDLDKNKWLKSIQSLDMPWVQTIEQNIINIEDYKTKFNITFIPQYFLINKNGSIVYHNLQFNGDDNFDKLTELLSAKFSDLSY